jgi:hypothetical protein
MVEISRWAIASIRQGLSAAPEQSMEEALSALILQFGYLVDEKGEPVSIVS